MKTYYRTTSVNGLRLRNSPYDGETLDILPNGTELKAIDEQTWVKVSDPSGKTGFVLKDYLEPTKHRITSNGIIQFRSKNGCIFSEQPICIHADFEKSLLMMENEAKKKGLKVIVTSSLRSPTSAVGDAVVRPASMSNHHVGHAVDVNLICKGIRYGSQTFADKQFIPKEVRRFIHSVCGRGLRWGGNFGTPDYVHFDDMLNIKKPEEYQRKLNKILG